MIAIITVLTLNIWSKRFKEIIRTTVFCIMLMSVDIFGLE